jgi:5-methyltetrahydrofolate--homocysteine methyltransferase
MTRTVLESKSKTVVIGFDEPFCVIGERINPTGRKILAAELEAGNFSTIEKDAIEQVASGAQVLDVNAGVVYNSNPNPGSRRIESRPRSGPGPSTLELGHG